MERKTELKTLLAILLVAFVIAACVTAPPSSAPAPVEDRVDSTEEEDEPTADGRQGVQVFPLQNPAVKELLAQAGTAGDQGRYEDAAVLLERALRIQPRDPELLQKMAEVQLGKQDYEQAVNFAVRSFDAGPRVGEICARNWRTIGHARRQLGDVSGAREARDRVEQCISARPERL